MKKMQSTAYENTTGYLFDIQRFSIHDGPGIRTTLFLKGCPLVCQWCHNPESWALLPEKTVDGSDKIYGYSIAAKEAIKTVLRDKHYYLQGGGVTFSGGEPLLQPEFLEALLRVAKDHGLHTALDTSGYASQKVLERILPFTDLILFDYKGTNATEHLEYTGASKDVILQNLEFLDQQKIPIILRCPIVPTINDTEEHFAAIRALRRQYPSIQSVDIMAYHTMGIDKWAQLGREYPLAHLPSVSPERKQQWVDKIHPDD